MKGFIFFGLCISPFYLAQTTPKDTLKTSEIQEVKFTKRLPVAKEIINVEKDLGKKNLGQDLPILLKNQTSVVSTSDAGNGVGYTGFRIRGVGGTSINVMMNGVPYNDSESQGTFFVDVPDLTSSASQIVIQRGVGTSSNGVSAFGASVNILSKNPDDQFYVKSDNSYGSFNTYKYSAEIGSGKFWDNRLSLMGRYTKIHSDGYIDRAFSDLDSYNFTAMYEEGKTQVRMMAFGGKEKTYQAWNGISKDQYDENPRYNTAGEYTDLVTGETKFYDNETDNYKQNHYQLLWKQDFSADWNLETTLHYTDGKGYYENYKQVDETDDWAAKFSDYNLKIPIVNGAPLTQSDFIRKKWLDNDFYGVVSTLYGRMNNVDVNFGLVGNQYYGRHYGNVTGVQLTDINEREYYRNRSIKNEIAGFAKAIYRINNWELFGDLQLRNITYDTKIISEGDGEGANMNKKWTFFNPKAGLSYRIDAGKIFLSYAQAHREPNRSDLFSNPETKPEVLHDFEAGVEKQAGKVQLSANAYYMYYKDQLVLTGEINNVGAFIRANSGKSYRMGLELGAIAPLSKQWSLAGNLTFSDNKNIDYKVKDDKQVKSLGDTPISFSPNILANLSLNYQPMENLSFGLQNKYVGSQYLNNENVEAFKLDPYFLTDLSAQYSLQLRRTQVNFNLLVNNLFNQEYINNGYTWGTTPYYYAQAGINFMFGVSFLFK